MDNIIFFFDNTTFKINNIIINYIKRLIIYEIIYKKIYKNEYNDVIIFKTCPVLAELKLNIHDENTDINNILLFINNIIYKQHENYGNISFKNIIDKIKDIETKTTKNKIIIICSINTENSFNETNINYINELFNNFTSDIKLINISNNSFFKNICPKINEFYINIKNLKIENILIKEIFNWDYNYIDLKLYTNTILTSNNSLINIDNANELIEYLLVLNVVEKIILNNIENKLDANIDLNKLIKQILIFELKTNNNVILNIIKSFQNSINNIIFRIANSCIKLPINNLNNILSESYIKYIL